MKTWIRQHPILAFLILNYAISWSFLYPSYQLILRHEAITPLSLIGLIGAYGPTIAAIAVQWTIDKSALKALLKKLLLVRCGWQAYLLVLLGPLLFYAAAQAMAVLSSGGALTVHLMVGLAALPTALLLALPFGPMGEELGWRGFMLPRLLERFSPVQSSILVGLAWGIWHLASFTFPGAAIPAFLPVNAATIGLYCLNTVALSLFFTYVHLKGRGSVFLAILLHTFFNAAASVIDKVLPGPEDVSVQTFAYAGNIVLVGAVSLWLLRRIRHV
ncbi:MAG: CPBP family intramembrane glutamic endopeptidase [Pseudomonadota bacterium]